jgi:hypothetical protein
MGLLRLGGATNIAEALYHVRDLPTKPGVSNLRVALR